jgi:hypothetical protein
MIPYPKSKNKLINRLNWVYVWVHLGYKEIMEIYISYL